MGEQRKMRRRPKVIALCVIVSWLFAWASAAFLAVNTDASAHADAVAVLAGSSAYIERARLASKVFKEARAPLIVLTDDGQRGGWSHEEQRNPSFAELSAAELRVQGVPAGSIEIAPGMVTSTFDEAVLLRRYTEAKGLRSILVVTSAYQVRRARWTFERVFRGSSVAVAFEAVPPGDQMPRPATWWLHMQGWRMVAGEYVKMAYYFARHG